jgi:hypothetical protein
MKNIHLIATDKPSRLYLEFGDGDLCLSNNILPQTKRSNNQHICITSDEDLKIGNWVLNIEENTIFKPSTYEIYHIKNSEAKYYEYCKKIILTTDQDLIKDGVQAIDDEFLKWFVKNPSCESVSVNKQYITPLGDVVDFCYDNERLNYKIIIPKEEPKQDTVGKEFYESADKVITVKRQEKKPHSFCETPEEQCTMNYCDENGCQNRVRHLVESKQEQDKKMYNEEDMIEFAVWMYLEVGQNSGKERTNKELFKEWFEQFKKEIT